MVDNFASINVTKGHCKVSLRLFNDYRLTLNCLRLVYHKSLDKASNSESVYFEDMPTEASYEVVYELAMGSIAFILMHVMAGVTYTFFMALLCISSKCLSLPLHH